MRLMRSIFLTACLGGFASALPGAAAQADDFAAVSRVSVEASEGATLLILETSRPVRAANSFFLETPGRFVVDLPGARLSRAGQGEGAGVAYRYRTANRPEGAARIVLDLNGAARLTGQRQERGGRRIVFELEGAPVTLAAASLPAEQPQAFQPQRGGRTIVIDAGHGGRDPGAIGVSGAREKDLVLAAAQRLKTQLEARGYTVFMTRDGDTFMELPNRVQFARAREADLFISLHADAAPGSNARGAAVYMLSERGQTRSRGLMHSQDWHIDVGDGGRGGGEVQNILIDLTQRETTNRSAEFANIVLNELETAGAPIMHRTPRNAGFFVLLAPDVPAVLVEMGFVTHAQDETRLADPVAQARMAGALADAVDAYFAAPRLMAAQD